MTLARVFCGVKGQREKKKLCKWNHTVDACVHTFHCLFAIRCLLTGSLSSAPRVKQKHVGRNVQRYAHKPLHSLHISKNHPHTHTHKHTIIYNTYI